MDSIFTNDARKMNRTDRLYLDHAATTPIIEAARAEMVRGMELWANPSSPHGEGRAARAVLEEAREQIASALGWTGDVILTSGASEAIKIGLSADNVRVSAVEHDAVLAMAPQGLLPVGEDGIVKLDHIKGPARYAIQHVNNETGIIQPVADIAERIRAEGGAFFADCSQSAGKLPLPDADLICVSAHKLGGPPGIGALLVKDLALLKPSGGQEQGYRRGTENLPAALAFAAALNAGFGWMAHAADLRQRLDRAIAAAGGHVVGGGSPRLATISSYHMPGVSASSQLIGFDMAGISVSAGSACSSGTLKASHVLRAMGWDDVAAGQVVRVSFGPQTDEADIDRFVASWRAIYARAKAG